MTTRHMDAEAPTLPPAEFVALNLFEARRLRGWTQQEAAERLTPYLKNRWTKSTLSAAEKSGQEGKKWRDFNARELVAFSRVFQLPVAWFFLPPETNHGLAYMDVAAGGWDEFVDPADIIMDLVFMNDDMQERVRS